MPDELTGDPHSAERIVVFTGVVAVVLATAAIFSFLSGAVYMAGVCAAASVAVFYVSDRTYIRILEADRDV